MRDDLYYVTEDPDVLVAPGDPVDCEHCGHPGTWREDPYMNEIHGDFGLYALCDFCERESAADI